MAQAKTTANENAGKASEDVAEQIAALKADVAGLASAIADLGKVKSSEFQAYAKDRADDAKAKAQVGADYMRQNAEQAYDRANDFVAERPATALGVAAAVGFLIGHFSARK